MEKELLLMEKVKGTLTVFLKNMKRLSFGSKNSDFKVG